MKISRPKCGTPLKYYRKTSKNEHIFIKYEMANRLKRTKIIFNKSFTVKEDYLLIYEMPYLCVVSLKLYKYEVSYK